MTFDDDDDGIEVEVCIRRGTGQGVSETGKAKGR